MTKRSFITLALFGVSLIVVLLGVGWISTETLNLVDREAEARKEALLEENVRLALWRMDSSLAPLLANESARPYFTYAAFYPAARAFDRMYAAVEANETLVASPLLDETIEHVLLHFQLDPDGTVRSPSVPHGKQRTLALASYIDEERLLERETRLGQLKTLLENGALAKRLPTLDAAQEAVAQAQRAQEHAQVKAQSGAVKVDQSPKLKSSNEWMARSSSLRQASNYSNVGNVDSGEYEQRAGANPGPSANAEAAAHDVHGAKDAVRARGLAVGEVRQGPLTPLWINGALVLARRVKLADAEYVQGCWLDWSSVREWLLSNVRDLLPEAQLHSIEGTGGAEERRLASVPAHLTAGTLPFPPEPLGTPVKWVLAVAWSGVLLAAAAVVALLFGTITLSERRAAFVSAVTHELRTPLTTFRMYSEMLEAGMVKSEEQRSSYLSTLKREALRLSHLVENVLAYARIERGRHTGRIETLPVQSTLERFGDRLQERAAQGGMSLELALPPAAEAGAGAAMRADATAVEQILFNLVDNACKYASSATDRSIRLSVDHGGGRVAIRVRDHGPGITAAAKRRLFAPFSRSAEAAAGSAPGVGLGLSLSRRLARTMGGDLALEDPEGGGACFVLTLPAAAAS